jgi:hypothetical protein
VISIRHSFKKSNNKFNFKEEELLHKNKDLTKNLDLFKTKKRNYKKELKIKVIKV